MLRSAILLGMNLADHPQSSFEIFYEAQTRLAVATHALVTQARRLAAARALSQDTTLLFDELEVFIMVERREAEALAAVHTALRAA